MFYIDGQMSGTAALNLSHGTKTGEASAIHITNSANTYSGTVTLTSTGYNETLDLDNITAMQYATVNLATTSTGTPYLQLGSANANATTVIDGLTSSAGIGIVNTNTAAGTYTLKVNDAADNTFGGVLANNTGILALTKTGAGTLTLSGANTFTGPGHRYRRYARSHRFLQQLSNNEQHHRHRVHRNRLHDHLRFRRSDHEVDPDGRGRECFGRSHPERRDP
jgi:hypothetical protein